MLDSPFCSVDASRPFGGGTQIRRSVDASHAIVAMSLTPGLVGLDVVLEAFEDQPEDGDVVGEPENGDDVRDDVHGHEQIDEREHDGADESPGDIGVASLLVVDHHVPEQLDVGGL